MNRFSEQTAADFAHNTAVSQYRRLFHEDPPVTFSVAVNLCESCSQSCERLFEVPEYGLKTCETCRDEAMVELAREVTPKPVSRQQGQLIREVA